MTIGIRGMGLIGGSFEKALVRAGHRVLNLKEASAADIRTCGLVIVCLPPLMVAPWIEAHAAETGSEKAKEILKHFDEYIPAFKKIIPKDYARMVESIAALESAGMPREDAEIEAFFAATRR